MNNSILIAANWKLNPDSVEEAENLAKQVLIKLEESIGKSGSPQEKLANLEVSLCVPSIFLHKVKSEIEKSFIKLGAQNCAAQEKGAFTGEISPLMLKDAGCKYVILGHSERRTLFAETNEIINQKVKLAIQHNLIPIVCVGESLEERESNKTDSVIIAQLQKSLADVKVNSQNLVIAYEPIWAIGTGKTCSSEEANRVCALIRNEICKINGAETVDKMFILYGGSVKSSTITEQMKQPHINGALVGGASLIAEEFVRLVLNSN